MPTLIVFIIYGVLILGITFRAYRQTQNYQDYILGGRRFGGIVTAMGVAATDMSAWLMLSVPAVFYLYGLDQIWLPVGLLLGSFVNWHWVGPRLRTYTQVAKNSLTLSSFFQNRFLAPERALIRPMSAIIFLIFFTCYAASGFVGAAKLVSTVFDLHYTSALWLSAPIVIAYTAIGGYLAVNWLDLLQGFLMLFTLLFLAIFAYFAMDSQSLVAMTQVNYPQHLDIFYDMSFLSVVSALAWGLGYFGQPHILVRFMSSQDIQSIRIGKYICLTWMGLAMASAAAIGLFGIAYFPIGSLSSAEVIFPSLAQHLLSPWFSALTFAAIISAIISTVAAVVFASASSLIEDLYCPFLRPKASSHERVWMGRLMVLIVASFAVFLAVQGESPSVFELVSHAWAGLGAAFGPLVLMALFWSRMSYTGAFLGMVMGGLVTLIWIYCSYHFSAPIFNLFEIIPGFFAGCLGVVIGSYLRPLHSTLITAQHTQFKHLIAPKRRGE